MSGKEIQALILEILESTKFSDIVEYRLNSGDVMVMYSGIELDNEIVDIKVNIINKEVVMIISKSDMEVSYGAKAIGDEIELIEKQVMQYISAN